MNPIEREINEVVAKKLKKIKLAQMGFEHEPNLADIDSPDPQVQIYVTHLRLDEKEQRAIMEAGDWLMNFIRINRGIK